MEQPIPIVADIPTDKPGLGFPAYVEALADAIRGGQPPQFTVGLYGAWGSGKSSLLAAIKKSLAEDSRSLPVYFDAWRHERADHIVVPLLYRIWEEAGGRPGHEAFTKQLGRVLEALLFSINFSFPGVGGLDTRKVKENLQESQESPMPLLDDAFSKPFEELRKLPASLGDTRVVVLIDDLDRCSPEKVVSLLEAINLVTDVEGFIFVLALDYDVLIEAVQTKYPHVSGHQFIEKMVQLPFRVPPLTVRAEGTAGANAFLGQLIPEWKEHREQFPNGFSTSVSDVADYGLKANPRQIKRLINSFLLLNRIVESRELQIDQELMASIIGLQLRWPAEYQELQDAILGDEKQPFEHLLRPEVGAALRRYADRFFRSLLDDKGEPKEEFRDSLRQVMQLTAVIHVEPVAEPRLSREERVIIGLEERGFVKDSKVEDSEQTLWHHPGLSDFRVVTESSVFSIQARFGDGHWETIPGLKDLNYRLSGEIGLNELDRLTTEHATTAQGVPDREQPLQEGDVG